MDGLFVDWVGYLGSFFVLISFLMKKTSTLRILNSIGCLLFVVYECMKIKLSWPIVITNLMIATINAYYLFFATTGKRKNR